MILALSPLPVAFLLTWWDELTLAKQVYYGIGLLACIVALLLAVLAFLGLEHHDAVDALDASDAGGGSGIFSVKPLTGFFLAFGWAGGAALDFGASQPVALLAAAGAGGALMALIVLMFRGIQRMRSDGTMRIDTAVGAVGTVYVTLPPAKAAGGQITVTINGRSETMPALSRADRPVPAGEKVRVIEVVDARTLLVEPI
jgi:membrane protein implicated in regulation of membrane protease activity